MANAPRTPALLCLALLGGCVAAPVVAVKPGYDFSRVRRVALLNFEDYPGFPSSGGAISSAFEPYLLQAGFDVVERRQVDKVLQEQAFSLSGAVDPQTAQALGKLLGVDALVLGSITTFSPGSSQMVITDVRQQTSQPVYDTEVHSDKDGGTTVSQRVRGYHVTRTNEQIPVTYTTPSSLGMAVRMVDATTGDVLWIGSCKREEDSIQAAADGAASQIMKALRKALPKPPLRKA